MGIEFRALRYPPVGGYGQTQQSKEYMPNVRVREGESFDIAIRRFKRSCEKAGVLSEVRRREYYEKPTAVRKRKAAAAVKRAQKILSRNTIRTHRMY